MSSDAYSYILNENLSKCDIKGECFRNAVRRANEIDGEIIDKQRSAGVKGKIETDVLVVHGMITNPLSKKTFAHGWVERDGKVIDPTIQVEMNVRNYYRKFSVDVLAKYTTDQAMVHSITTRNYGPWTKGEVGSKSVVFLKSLDERMDRM